MPDIQREIKMATIKLTQPTTFYRQHEGDQIMIDLPTGKSVEYSREDTPNWYVHIASYTDGDGNGWTSTVRKPRQTTESPKAAAQAPCPCCGVDRTKNWPCSCTDQMKTASTPAPSVATVAAVQMTAMVTHEALGQIAARQITATDECEGRVRQLAHIADSLRGDVYQVNYYIPSSLSDEVDNPSRIFRKHGFRLDGSNWVFPAAGLEHRDVQKVLRGWDTMAPQVQESSLPGFAATTRVRYWTIKYTRDQLSQMKDLAQSQLAEELQKTHRSLIERIDSAAAALEAAQVAATNDGITITQRDRDKAECSHNARIRAIIVESCERFDMCLKGAEIFDDTGSLDALFGAVRDAILTKALAANAILREKRVKMVTIPASIAS